MSVYIRTVHGNSGDDGNMLADGWDLLRWINDDVHKEFPAAITIAEDLQNSADLVRATSDGGAGFGSQWDAGFVHPVRGAMIVSDDQQRNLDDVIAALKHGYDGDAFKRIIYSESHDEVANGKARLPTEIAPSQESGFFAKSRSTLGAVLVLTAPGIPMLFQGQEFLEDEWFRDTVPVDWSKLERFAGIHAMYRDLIALRRNLRGFTKGLSGQHIETNTVNHEKKVLGFHRWMEGGPGDDVIVVLNLSAEPVTDYAVGVPAGGLWKVRFNSGSKLYSEDFTDHTAFDIEAIEEPLDGLSHRIVTGIGPYAAVIYSQDPPQS
jgi:1,4-alpha-glucan branching enzyme